MSVESENDKLANFHCDIFLTKQKFNRMQSQTKFRLWCLLFFPDKIIIKIILMKFTNLGFTKLSKSLKGA